MKPINFVGNYAQCPYCKKLFGNGISVVYSNIVEGCSCEGMRNAVKIDKLQKQIESLVKNEKL